jgi:hypothetical protein
MRSVAAFSYRSLSDPRFLILILVLVLVPALRASGQSAAGPQSPPHTSNPPAPAEQEQFISYGQNSHRARYPTHEPHFKHRFMINQAR